MGWGIGMPYSLVSSLYKIGMDKNQTIAKYVIFGIIGGIRN
jgi:hypothetical protein